MLGALLVFAAVLSACGSEKEESGLSPQKAGAPVSLQQPEDVARAVAYLNIAQFFNQSFALQADFRPAVARKAQVQAKLRIEDDCPEGGQYVYDWPSGSETIQMDFDHCQRSEGQRHGRLVQHCREGSFGDETCPFVAVTFGAQEDRLRFAQMKRELSTQGMWTRRENRGFVFLTQNLETGLKSFDEDFELIYRAENFLLESESLEGGQQLLSLSGSLGLATLEAEGDCAEGKVEFFTNDRLQINAEGVVVAGELRLENAENEIAYVEFLNNGDLAINIGEQTEVLLQEEFASLCRFLADQ